MLEHGAPKLSLASGMNAGIGIIVNPHARSNRRAKRDPAERFAEIGDGLADVRKTQNLEEVEQAAKDFRATGVSFVGVSGGDGSCHHAITRLIRAYAPGPPPPVLLLKGGTMDLAALAVGLKGRGPDILERLVRTMREGREVEIQRRDTLKIGTCTDFCGGRGS